MRALPAVPFSSQNRRGRHLFTFREQFEHTLEIRAAQCRRFVGYGSLFEILAFRRNGETPPEGGAVTPERIDPPAKPRIGLALGGGAARGWAHIGVIRALTAAGFDIDVIAGTSIGAVVGGCYAAGRLDELEEWARALTKRRMFSLIDLSFAGAGMMSGGRLRELLENEVGPTTIEGLPIRFVAVATEISTGHEIWMQRGRLVDAVRASYALPGIFEPVRVGGRWLMDGALVNPVPVTPARALGARLVVSVNLNADLYGRGAVVPGHGTDERDEALLSEWQAERQRPRLNAARSVIRRPPSRLDGPPGIPTVMIEAFNITQDRIARARLAGDPPDVSIGPKLGGIGLFEFHRAAETIALGAEATERALDNLREAATLLA